MDIERYGSKLKLPRVTAYVLKFIRLLRGDRSAVKSKELTAEDLNSHGSEVCKLIHLLRSDRPFFMVMREAST